MVAQPFEVAALAFPIADRVVDELQVADAAEVRNRKYRAENRLQADVLTLIRELVHLQKPLVRFLLHLDQVRNRDRGLDLGKIHSLGDGAVILICHSITPDGRTANAKGPGL
jgi:hypothetical protein